LRSLALVMQHHVRARHLRGLDEEDPSAIITHEGKNMLIKKTVDCETDTLSHVYTFVLSPNNTFKILIGRRREGRRQHLRRVGLPEAQGDRPTRAAKKVSGSERQCHTEQSKGTKA